MRLAITGARCLAGAAALALGAAGFAQDAPVPRADGYAELERLPDWSGVWNPDWSLLFGGGAGGAPAQPKLTPAAQARLDAFLARQAAEGVDQTAPYPMEVLFTPGRVTIFAETYSQARRIYTDGRALPDDPDFLFNGSSIGRWDGDTLHVDTVGFSPATMIAAGIPHGEKMRIQERIWLDRPDVLMIETTITDPDVLTEPFVQRMAYRRQPDWEIREYVCEENNRLTPGEGGANIDLGLDEEDDPFGPPPGE
jgi:hypothetical protein